MNPYDLHPERLATTDEHGKRVYLYPEDVQGKWRSRRKAVFVFLILIYIITPWLYIDGKQLMLFDIPNRYFIIMGQEFWAHDTPYLFFILAFFLFFIAAVTSVLGRVWCGWTCPQTVFTELLYRPIEKLVEGKAVQRRKLDESPWGWGKFSKRSLKWLLFLFVSLVISHSFLGYFLGTHYLVKVVARSPFEHWESFIFMLVVTGITLFDFGWFREQFCIIMCPYGRFQSVIMDSNSLVVAYDYNRGEPRRQKSIDKESQGDCIDCFHCVRACPTGIDIRRGTQLECIACTMCIDACDNMMDKLKKPFGLIRYTTENSLINKKSIARTFKRPLVYFFIMGLIVSIGIYSLSGRQKLKAQFLRGGNQAYQEIVLQTGTKEITNHFRIELTYQGKKELNLVFDLDGELKDRIKIVTPIKPFFMKKGRKKVANVFLKFNPKILRNGVVKIPFLIKHENEIIFNKEIILVGPLK